MADSIMVRPSLEDLAKNELVQSIRTCQENGDVFGVITLYFEAQKMGFIPEWIAQVGTEMANTILQAIEIARRVHG